MKNKKEKKNINFVQERKGSKFAHWILDVTDLPGSRWRNRPCFRSSPAVQRIRHYHPCPRIAPVFFSRNLTKTSVIGYAGLNVLATCEQIQPTGLCNLPFGSRTMPDGEQQLTTTSSSSTSSTSENRNESGSFYITFLYSTMYVVEILLIILLAITSYASLQKG